MSKHFSIVASGVAGGLVLAGMAGLLAWRTAGSREPAFAGRPLSSWLDHHVPSSAANPPYGSPGWDRADEAIRSIGTNAIPTLLKMIRARDRPPFVLKLMELARRLGFTRMKYRPAMWRHEEATYAFELLGTNAANAVPELIRIYEQNISASSHQAAAQSLGHIGPGARAALPALIRRFTHTNGVMRFQAVSAVMKIGGEPEVVVPALTRALQDPNGSVRWNAMVGLSGFGKLARPVVPEILKMLNDPGVLGNNSLKQQVELALWRIAPEKVGKPLVVEDATPMIADGLTTQALKVAFREKREILIPSGRPVPACAQYWGSDPRPGLTLYRGAGTSEDADHFLGHFEVLDIPASERPNISTLCVIADGQIILCARDNHREMFLPIRRVEMEAEK